MSRLLESVLVRFGKYVCSSDEMSQAIIWKLFMDEYPNLEIEVDIKDHDYLPDGKSSVWDDSENRAWSPHEMCQITNCKSLMSAMGKILLFGARLGE